MKKELLKLVFNRTSVPIKNVIDNSIVSNVRKQVIEILSKQKGDVAQSILKEINKNSANIHWSAKEKKIIIIDML